MAVRVVREPETRCAAVRGPPRVFVVCSVFNGQDKLHVCLRISRIVVYSEYYMNYVRKSINAMLCTLLAVG